MKLIDSSDEKVKKICDVLVRDTLEPAQKQAQDILEEAKQTAENIVEKGRKKAQELIDDAEKTIEEKQRVFDSSLKIASQKALTALRDQIEKQLFSEELHTQINKYLSEKEVVARLVDALTVALNKEGIKANLEVLISEKFKPEEICAAVLEDTLKSIKQQTIHVGNIEGVVVKSEKHAFSVDVTDEAILELLSRYAQESLRKILFNL